MTSASACARGLGVRRSLELEGILIFGSKESATEDTEAQRVDTERKQELEGESAAFSNVVLSQIGFPLQVSMQRIYFEYLCASVSRWLFLSSEHSIRFSSRYEYLTVTY